MRELDPRTTTELINRWERLCGLPDECIPAGTQTLRQRQQRLDAKVNLAGGINEDFYLCTACCPGQTRRYHHAIRQKHVHLLISLH